MLGGILNEGILLVFMNSSKVLMYLMSSSLASRVAILSQMFMCMLRVLESGERMGVGC